MSTPLRCRARADVGEQAGKERKHQRAAIVRKREQEAPSIASTHADECKPLHLSRAEPIIIARRYSYRSGHPETAPWHYVDIDFDKPDLKAACPDKGCLPAKIEQFEAVLADPARPAAIRAQALIWLLHLVGDVHQPLHTIDRHEPGGQLRGDRDGARS